MTSLFRPFLTSILCCVIAFGHAPAWLHVATCDSHSHAEASLSSEKAESTCSHSCHHHHDSEAAPVVQVGGDSGTHHEHDSDNCPICQSLASPCGVTWQLSLPLVTGLVSQPALLPAEWVFASATLSIAHPRGPPKLA